MDDWITICELAQRGMSVSAIARHTNHDRKTIRQILTADAPRLERQTRGLRASKLDPYRVHVLRRIDEGCVNAAVLLDEIHGQGFLDGGALLWVARR